MENKKLEYLPLDDLIPYARNSRTHSDEQVAQIAASIKEFGFTNPVLIDDEGGIIAGHGRCMAARKLKLDEVPCIRLTGLTDAQKKAYIIADNKLALNAGWDDEMLALEIQELQEMSFDIELMGFTLDEIGDLDLDEEDGYSDKNKEIDVDSFEDIMELKFKLTFSEYEEANERLKEIANSPEIALKILLKMEV
jgi:hypothetical protein